MAQFFLLLQFGFVTFWQKDIGKKGAHKMLMKLTIGRNDYFNSIFIQLKLLILKKHFLKYFKMCNSNF